MINSIADKVELRAILKELLIELLQERDESISILFQEVIEELALTRAIDEGLATETVSRDAIFSIARVRASSSMTS